MGGHKLLSGTYGISVLCACDEMIGPFLGLLLMFAAYLLCTETVLIQAGTFCIFGAPQM